MLQDIALFKSIINLFLILTGLEDIRNRLEV